MMDILEVLKLKQLGFISPIIQIILVCVFVTLAVTTQRKEYKLTGKTYGRYPWRVSTFLSSIYEEVIFRGFILFGLLRFLSPLLSIIISSALFGLWHFKNYKWQTSKETLHQVLYAGLVFGPLVCLLTLYTGTIWLGVIVHYIHNFLVDAFRKKRL